METYHECDHETLVMRRIGFDWNSLLSSILVIMWGASPWTLTICPNVRRECYKTNAAPRESGLRVPFYDR